MEDLEVDIRRKVEFVITAFKGEVVDDGNPQYVRCRFNRYSSAMRWHEWCRINDLHYSAAIGKLIVEEGLQSMVYDIVIWLHSKHTIGS